MHTMKEIIKLIESSDEGIIRIWNFHSGELIKKSQVIDDITFSICLWNKDYLFVGCNNKTIGLVNINDGTIYTTLPGHKGQVTTIKKIIHRKYGECLISFEGDIILWTKE